MYLKLSIMKIPEIKMTEPSGTEECKVAIMGEF